MHLHSSQTSPQCRLESAFADLPLGQRRSVLPHWRTPCTLQPQSVSASMSYGSRYHSVLLCDVCHYVVKQFIRICCAGLFQQQCAQNASGCMHKSEVHRTHFSVCSVESFRGEVPSSPQTDRARAGTGQVQRMCTFKAVIPYKLGFSQSCARPQNCSWPLYQHPLACIQSKQCLEQCQSRGYHRLWQVRHICRHP